MEAWREESWRRVVGFTQQLRPAIPVNVARLRARLAAGDIHDAAVRSTMQSLDLSSDHLLLLIGAFIAGAAFELPESGYLRDAVAVLTEVGLVQDARYGGWGGLTERGRQFAVYAIYRLLAEVVDDAGCDE